MVRFACSLAMAACFTLSAAADIAPPAVGFKRVPYEHVMKLETEIPEYKFYTFQRLGIGGRETHGDELLLGTKNGVAKQDGCVRVLDTIAFGDADRRPLRSAGDCHPGRVALPPEVNST